MNEEDTDSSATATICSSLRKSKRAAERTLENLIPFIERKLFLKVNREKTVVAYVGKVKFLGYAFYTNKNKDVGLTCTPQKCCENEGEACAK